MDPIKKQEEGIDIRLDLFEDDGDNAPSTLRGVDIITGDTIIEDDDGDYD